MYKRQALHDAYISVVEALKHGGIAEHATVNIKWVDSEEPVSYTHLMMDGGRGQVNICLKVLDELHLNIPVCGMVKDDNHRTRGLYYNLSLIHI